MSPPPQLPCRDRRIDRVPSADFGVRLHRACTPKPDPEEIATRAVTSLMRHAVTKLREAIRHSSGFAPQNHQRRMDHQPLRIRAPVLPSGSNAAQR